MKLALTPAILIALFATSTVYAADLGLSADISSLGAGLHLTAPVQQDLNARIGFNAYNYSYTGSTSEVNYDFKLKLQSIDALLDWYPGSDGFHISAGFVHNGNKITSVANANVSGTYTINGHTYTASSAGTIDGDITFRTGAPYLGIGWGNAVGKEKGWGFTSDLGVIAQGTPTSTLTNSGCTATAPICAQLNSDLAVEENNLNSKLNNLKTYPVLRIGAYYHF
jgi:hypothetical protein